MAASARDDDFDEYDKPGAERSRRRRGADEEMDSDLEGDLLEEDWLSSKKNPSELSDEELNDDLLQSDEEDQNNGGEAVSLNATLNLTSSYVFEGEDLGEGGGHAEEKGYEVTEGGEENCKAGEFAVEEGGGMEYATGQNEETYEDEVLELDINEPLDDEFQVSDYGTEAEEQQGDQQEVPQVEEGEQEEEEEKAEDRGDLQATESEEMEPEAEGEHEADVREESDEDEEEEESGRLRFKTERKDVTVVRLADAASKRRNIPETLELTEEAKADLLEFEEKERQKRQGRFGGRGRGGGIGGGRGRGGGGRGGPPMFRSGDFRHNGGGGRGKINEQRPPLMQMNLGMQPRLIQTHHSSRPAGPRGGPGLFPAPLGPLSQQPLQMLMHNRSPGPPPKQQQQQQQELHGPRGLNTPPLPAHSHSGPQHQPKNIHINPHFRGPASSAGQVPLMPPAQNQPRPNVSPQRFPGPAEFQPHLQGNFGQPQRPPPPEPWRGPPPHHHQEREPFFGEPRFPGQHVFDLPGPPPLINNILPLANQGPMPFPQLGGLSGPSGPGGPGFGPLGIGQGQGPPPGGGGGGGLFQNLPPQHGPSSPGPRGFMGHRQQPFPPQQQQQQPQGGPPFSPQHMPFGMQGIMQPHSQPQHHDPPPSHHPLHHQQHRQDLPMQGHPLPPHNQHHQRQPADQHPIMHLSHSQFRQPLQGGPRQMQQPRPQNSQQQQQQRNNLGRMRMSSPPALQQLHTPPHRNSNLRELPIATGNAERPSQHAGQSRPVPRSPQDARAGLGAAGGGGVGRGRGAAKTQQPPPAAVRAKKEEEPAAQPSTATPDPDEDEETRQYRLKIEEQKRLREEILKRKELRRQMQAGARKKELMERQGQSQNQTQNQVQSSQPGPQLQPPSQQVPSLASNGAPQTPTPGPCLPHPNAKPRPELQVPGQPAQWQQQQQQQQQRKSISAPSPQRPTPPFHNNPQSGPGGPPEAQMQALRPGGKRTVMQRSNSAGSPQVPQKVRVVKRLGEPGPNLNTPSQPQQQQQQQQQQQHQPQLQQLQQHQQHLPGRPVPQQRLGNVRKITVASDGTRQQLDASSGPTNQVNRVVVPVRGRGRVGLAGRGGNRIMTQQARQNPKTPELQPCTVCIGGLSSNTTEKQIKNLLNSIGPIQMLKMIPQQRKAIAKFTNHQHALSFQHSFHRHMIDLSNIDVSLIDD